MFCFIYFITNITFPKVRYHFIANEMEKTHYFISRCDHRLSICSLEVNAPFELFCARSFRQNGLSPDLHWPCRLFMKKLTERADNSILQLLDSPGITGTDGFHEQVPKEGVQRD